MKFVLLILLVITSHSISAQDVIVLKDSSKVFGEITFKWESSFINIQSEASQKEIEIKNVAYFSIGDNERYEILSIEFLKYENELRISQLLVGGEPSLYKAKIKGKFQHVLNYTGKYYQLLKNIPKQNRDIKGYPNYRQVIYGALKNLSNDEKENIRFNKDDIIYYTYLNNQRSNEKVYSAFNDINAFKSKKNIQLIINYNLGASTFTGRDFRDTGVQNLFSEETTSFQFQDELYVLGFSYFPNHLKNKGAFNLGGMFGISYYKSNLVKGLDQLDNRILEIRYSSFTLQNVGIFTGINGNYQLSDLWHIGADLSIGLDYTWLKNDRIVTYTTIFRSTRPDTPYDYVFSNIIEMPEIALLGMARFKVMYSLPFLSNVNIGLNALLARRINTYVLADDPKLNVESSLTIDQTNFGLIISYNFSK